MTSEEKQNLENIGQKPETLPELLEPSLEKALAEAVQKSDSYLESWKRAQADYINLKRRTDQEKLEMAKYSNTQLLINLLPVLDDFERAFQTMPHRMAKSEWVEGFRLIANKLLATLAAQGVKRIEAVGKPFDPSLHEACMHDKGDEGIVIKELSKGYMLFDKVIRPTQAVVGNGEKDEPGVKPDNNHINNQEEASK